MRVVRGVAPAEGMSVGEESAMVRTRVVSRSVVGLVAGVVAVLAVGVPAQAAVAEPGDTHWGAPQAVAAVEPGDTHWGIVPAAVSAEPGDTHWGADHDGVLVFSDDTDS
ncbi:hypothetical protein VT52_010240 [Streptomyces malaysiense]|uniref:Uncharacterized protein n=2 Tax=Streptomyces malaysiense TaxID=1428626 RepID=A0A1J4Q5L7_9ACTN|nr:hypothetical protein VT52_010240 [Streptomyces malaysiense]